jgi:hypothetical protein
MEQLELFVELVLGKQAFVVVKLVFVGRVLRVRAFERVFLILSQLILMINLLNLIRLILLIRKVDQHLDLVKRNQ